MAEIRGHKGEDLWLPHCLGHEGVGTVLDAGNGVKNVSPGDLVVLSWIKGIGIDSGGCKYKSGKITVNAGAVTSFQRHAVVSENRLYKITKDSNLTHAILLGCAAPTGMGVIKNVLRVQKDASLIVFGAGGIGLQACLAAKTYGASTITVVDKSDDRLRLAKLHGATDVINSKFLKTEQEYKNNLSNLYDFAIDATGVASVMESCLEYVKPQGGKVAIIGNAQFGSQISIDPKNFNQGKSLLGTWGGDSQPDRDYAKYQSILKDNSSVADELISAPYSLEDINKALQDFEEGKIARPLIDMKL